MIFLFTLFRYDVFFSFIKCVSIYIYFHIFMNDTIYYVMRNNDIKNVHYLIWINYLIWYNIIIIIIILVKSKFH